MGYLELFILAFGLSVDSFAVSVCTGVANKTVRFSRAVVMASILGLIQGLAPIIGGLLGSSIKDQVQELDHWISLGLLLLVGGKMIYDGIRSKGMMKTGKILRLSSMFGMGIATSIDAVVVGVTLGLVGTNLISAGFIIAIITFFAVMIGLLVGSRLLGMSKLRLEIVAGIVLIGLGIKIFIEHSIAGI